ncbi:MAG: toxin-antitoxin system HicB family antitoxin [Isosphaeraceae bacterium]
MPPRLHEQLASWAKEDRASLNMLVVTLLEKAVEAHAAEPVGAGRSAHSSR